MSQQCDHQAPNFMVVLEIKNVPTLCQAPCEVTTHAEAKHAGSALIFGISRYRVYLPCRKDVGEEWKWKLLTLPAKKVPKWNLTRA